MDPRDSACWALPWELPPPTPGWSKQKARYSLPALPIPKSRTCDGSDAAGKPLQDVPTLDCALVAASGLTRITGLKGQEAENSTVPRLLSSLPPSWRATAHTCNFPAFPISGGAGTLLRTASQLTAGRFLDSSLARATKYESIGGWFSRDRMNAI